MAVETTADGISSWRIHITQRPSRAEVIEYAEHELRINEGRAQQLKKFNQCRALQYQVSLGLPSSQRPLGTPWLQQLRVCFAFFAADRGCGECG